MEIIDMCNIKKMQKYINEKISNADEAITSLLSDATFYIIIT